MNLPKLILELVRAGVSQNEIAKAMDVTQATVSRYATGEIKNCTYPAGAALIELHLLHVPQRARRKVESRPT